MKGPHRLGGAFFISAPLKKLPKHTLRYSLKFAEIPCIALLNFS